MNKSFNKKALPHRYRKMVVEILSQQGLQVSIHDVSNIIRGRVTDPKKTEAVINALKKMRRNHARNQRFMATIKPGA
jgi:tRNA(Phe) wybutosine-synthesizing methylase Tyw3